MIKKNIISVIIILLTTTVLWAQDSLVIEKYFVEEYYLNHKLMKTTGAGHYISFVQKRDTTFFINGFEEFGTYSIGEISKLEMEDGTYTEDDQIYVVNRSQFLWHYKNSYDNNKGLAKVDIRKTFFRKSVSFRMLIFLENKDTIALYGFAKYSIPEDEFILPIKGEWISLSPLILDKTSIGFLAMYDSDYHRFKDSLWTTSGSIYYNRVIDNEHVEMEQSNFDYYIDPNNISIIVTGSDVLEGLSRYNLTYELIDKKTLILFGSI